MVVLAFFAVAFFALIIFLVLLWVGVSAWAIGKAFRGEQGEVQEIVKVPVAPPGAVDEPEIAPEDAATNVSAGHADRRD